jgi:hypothetical protein
LKEDIRTNQQQNNNNFSNNNHYIDHVEQQTQAKPKDKKRKSMTEDDLDSGKRNKSLDFEDVRN